MNTALVDCGGANIASLRFALERLGVKAHFTRDARRIEGAERVLLPGVGAAGAGMGRLADAGPPGAHTPPDATRAGYLPGDAVAL